MEAEYMNFRFNEERQMMRKMVRDFAQKEIAPFVPSMEQGVFERDFAKMGELGLMGIPAPAKYGGAEMDFISYILAIEEISKVSATVGVILAVHTSVGMNPILYFGTEEQKKKYVSKLATGEYLGAFALTEPNAGSDAGSLKSRAVKKVIIILLMDRKCLLQMVVKQVHTLYSLLQIQRQEKVVFLHL